MNAHIAGSRGATIGFSSQIKNAGVLKTADNFLAIVRRAIIDDQNLKFLKGLC
jgi:hypothetical protein